MDVSGEGPHDPLAPTRVNRPFDPEALLRHLADFQVEYVLVGGFAGVLHGARRPTMDLDIVPRWDEENLRRLCDALRALDATSASGPPVRGNDITPALLEDREMMNWHTALGGLDTLVGIPDAEGLPVAYDQLVRRSIFVRVASLDIEVAALDDIVVSKEFADRVKDARALPELRRLRDLGSQPPDGPGGPDGMSL